jgi:hypothetical protein
MEDFDAMVATVSNWLKEEKPENRLRFLQTPKDKLVSYHHTLGRDIRNEFKLWDAEWKPDMRDGVDCSPDHPDQLSMRVIETVWDGFKENV